MRDSDELASAFFELEAVVRGSSRLPGLAAARVEARRRRGRQVAWTAAAVVVLVLAGVATVVPGWLRRGDPPVLNPSPSVTTGSPSPSATTPSPTVTTDSTPATVLADMTPPERVRNASLDVPAFDLAGCPSGRLPFVNGGFGSLEAGQLTMDVAGVGDFDADGLEDVVVALRCDIPAGTHGEDQTQVLAYSGPGLALRGPVTARGDGTQVVVLQVSPDGAIHLGLAQVSIPRGQVLTITFANYRWTGSGFDSIEANEFAASDLPRAAISAEPAVVQLTQGGPAQRVVVTVRNDGPTLATPLRFNIFSSGPVSIEVEGVTEPEARQQRSLLIAAPRAGEAVTVALRIALPAGAALPGNSSIIVGILGQQATVSGSLSIGLRPA